MYVFLGCIFYVFMIVIFLILFPTVFRQYGIFDSQYIDHKDYFVLSLGWPILFCALFVYLWVQLIILITTPILKQYKKLVDYLKNVEISIRK